ncbi:hypothetical protein OB236_09605 [Paenibacillus sp. WQ 127069]|uniref:XRE family transcriptional regulator n=1 Tax=Paenibacillus baimaensis TaxID=2982185 RepID=A0ABT2UCL9_9BACL|nr:hypothetical protein [Paenibacillus sp. WQ 127069]MCU6792383.1 hypothetical protein [Paenibacillus sp. WQ 127069]
MTKEKKKDCYNGALFTSHEFYSKGSGLTFKEIAEKLGVKNLTNSNPNKNLIKRIAEFYKLPVSGTDTTMTINSTNRSDTSGVHLNEKKRYDNEATEKIKEVIDFIILDGDLEFQGIKFRIK